MSVFLILIFFIGSVSASSENDTQLLSQSIGEVVNEDNTDEILTVEVSSAGSNDSGLKELEGNKSDLLLNNSNTIQTSKSVLRASNDNYVLGNAINVEGNTFADIKTAIDSSNDGDIIFLNGDTYVGSGTSITINKKITIVGGSNLTDNAKATLDAKMLSKMFTVSSSNVTVKNILFVNGNGTNFGGAIQWTGINGKLINCQFINNTNPTNNNMNGNYGGGSIYWSGANGTIVNSSFNNCSNSYGASIRSMNDLNIIMCNFTESRGTYGSVYISGKQSYVNFSNCLFLNISRVRAPIYGTGRVNLDGCGFINCKAGRNVQSSGAIYFQASNGICNIINCYFTNCSSDDRDGGAAAITFQNPTSSENRYVHNIVNCNFTNCSAVYYGAIVPTDANIINCNFVNNTAPRGVISEGGSTISGVLNITSCKFINNTEGIYLSRKQNITINDCIFANNTRGIFLATSANVKYCNFTNNSRSIYCGGDNTTVENSNFINNNGSGATLYFSGCNITIKYCNFTDNTATAGTGGGAIYIQPKTSDSINIILSNSYFANNSGNYAGAIVIYGYGSNDIPIISNSTFIDNKANSKELTSSLKKYILTFNFNSNENYINAIYTSKTITFSNVTYWNGDVVNSDDVTPMKSSNEAGVNITVEVYNSQGNLVDNVTLMTNSSGQVDYNYSKLNYEQYTYKAYHPEDTYYTYIENIGNFMGPKKYNIIVLNNQTYYELTKIPIKLNAIIKDNQTGRNIKPSNTKLLFIYLHKL